MKKIAHKNNQLQTVGVIGLGIMGGMMAEALCAAGYSVVGYDPAAPARKRLQKAGGKRLTVAEFLRGFSLASGDRFDT